MCAKADSREAPQVVAARILADRYPDADCIFLAGSVIRGQATDYSDLDIVVVYEQVERARRESFIYASWPVEVFVHDPQTLDYFFRKVDRVSGVPSLADMVANGIALPTVTAIAMQARRLAMAILEEGPPPWSDRETATSRYLITDLVDDIRDPRSHEELVAALTRLYPAVAEHFLRANGWWSAKGKSIPRRLRQADPDFAKAFDDAFRSGFEGRGADPVIGLCQRALEPSGGWLFDGHALDAPDDWR